MSEMKLRHLADIQNSNVDKVIIEDEPRVRLCNYVDVYKNDFITPDMEFNPGSATPTEIDRFRVKVGDVIITKDSEDRHDIGVPAYVRETADDLVCGYHLTMLRAFKDRADGAFLFWALQSKPAKETFAIAANGVTRYGLTQEGIKGLPLWVPNLPTQRWIAAFLDRETARIDELIGKKERMLELHKARRLSEISQLLSKGIRQVSDWKHSGYDWMGEIPAHWQWVRMKDVCSEVIDCKNRTPPQVDESQYLVIRTTCIKDGHFVAEGGFPTDSGSFSEWTKRGKPSAGDVLITREAPMGEACLYPAELEACLGQRMMLYRPNPRVIRASYIVHTIYSAIGQHYIGLRKKGSTVGHLRVPEVYNFPCLLPPLDEQDEILARLDSNSHTYGELESKVKKSIHHLREYRAALITAAVIGQIDVDTYGKTGTTSETLDRIEGEMQA